jgi:hypothetical protein
MINRCPITTRNHLQRRISFQELSSHRSWHWRSVPLLWQTWPYSPLGPTWSEAITSRDRESWDEGAFYCQLYRPSAAPRKLAASVRLLSLRRADRYRWQAICTAGWEDFRKCCAYVGEFGRMGRKTRARGCIGCELFQEQLTGTWCDQGRGWRWVDDFDI